MACRFENQGSKTGRRSRVTAAPLAEGRRAAPSSYTQPPAYRGTAQYSSVDIAEVVKSIESLYEDQLRPYGRILRKRLAERAEASGRGSVDIDVGHLHALCESCPWLCVQSEDGGDWSVLLQGRQSCFADVYSPCDIYPAELWLAASAYFSSLGQNDMVLPGGRYLCSQVLVARGLPFLARCTLGQICHIVQLAISQKKILGYLNGAIVPYGRSQSMVKDRCAKSQRPCASGSVARNLDGFAGWDTVRACLVEIMKGFGPGTSSIPLSNVKRLFRSRFHVELSETALGYAKLSELFQDEHLRDLCKVRLQGQGYVIVPAARVQRSPVTLADKLPPRESPSAGVVCGGSLRERAPWITPLISEDISTPQVALPKLSSPSVCSKDGAAVGLLFSPTVFPPTPSPTSMHGQALPKLLGSFRRGENALHEMQSFTKPASAVDCTPHEQPPFHASLAALNPGASPWPGFPTHGFMVPSTYVQAGHFAVAQQQTQFNGSY